MSDAITDIIHEKNRVQVIVNGEETLLFSRHAFSRRMLTLNETIDLEELKEWLSVCQYPQALNKAVSLLALRARSVQEVRQKLESAGYLERVIDLALYKLEKEGFLNDEAFARDWAKARIQRQLGKNRILQELRQKGIPRDVAECALAEMDADDASTEAPIQKLALKLLRRVQNEPDPRKGMQKVLAAMARRGFSYGEASEAIKAALAEAAQECPDGEEWS